MIAKETQYKINNPPYRGLTFAILFMLVITLGALYAALYDWLQPARENTGEFWTAAIFFLLPVLFLILRLTGKITTEITEKQLVFRNYNLFPVETFRIDLNEISHAVPVRIKVGQYNVGFFTSRLFTYKKILYVGGFYALKLKSKVIKKDTVIMGTQKLNEWIESFRSHRIEIQEDDKWREVQPVPFVEKQRVETTQRD